MISAATGPGTKEQAPEAGGAGWRKEKLMWIGAHKPKSFLFPDQRFAHTNVNPEYAGSTPTTLAGI